jgi:DNA-binding LacI/PurR family transcriptional regulator
MQAPYQSAFLEACVRKVQEIGKVVMVLNTAGESGNVEAALRQSLNYRADATIVVSGTPPTSLIQTCIDHGQRVILINRNDLNDGTECIMVDNKNAAREAFEMLRRAGCERLAVVSSTAGTPSLTAREAAFLEIARENKLKVPAIHVGRTNYETGAASARRLLAEPDRPDGVFCVTDLLAMGFMDVARQEFALKIPCDLCVVGFDDIPEARWGSYNLTTFRQPLEDIAAHIASILSTPIEVSQYSPIALQPVWRGTVRT